MRYLLTHMPLCRCRDRVPQTAATIHAVTRWLWGRRLDLHTVYDGETPYYLQMGSDVTNAAILERYAAPRVRGRLPLILTARMCEAEGIHYGHACPPDTVVCVIGGPPHPLLWRMPPAALEVSDAASR